MDPNLTGGLCRGCAPAPEERAFHGPLDAPLRDEVTTCPKCHNAALREDRVSKSCPTCGTEIFIRDGDWRFERPRRPTG